jgi:hypothetical protein
LRSRKKNSDFFATGNGNFFVVHLARMSCNRYHRQGFLGTRKIILWVHADMKVWVTLLHPIIISLCVLYRKDIRRTTEICALLGFYVAQKSGRAQISPTSWWKPVIIHIYTLCPVMNSGSEQQDIEYFNQNLVVIYIYIYIYIYIHIYYFVTRKFILVLIAFLKNVK